MLFRSSLQNSHYEPASKEVHSLDWMEFETEKTILGNEISKRLYIIIYPAVLAQRGFWREETKTISNNDRVLRWSLKIND